MVKIVRAEGKHIHDIGKLWWEFMVFHQGVDPVFTPRAGSIPGFEQHIGQQIKSNDVLVLVALDDGISVGFSLSEVRSPGVAYTGGKRGYIDTLAVTAAYRRKGVGEKMVSETLSWFGSKGIKRVELETAALNAVANSFWRKQGFEVYRHRLYKEI